MLKHRIKHMKASLLEF